MTRWAAIAIACSPEEQKRLTVMPARRHRQARAQRGLARDVLAGGALRQRAADDHVLDLAGLEPRALHGARAITWPPSGGAWVLLNAPR